MPEFWLKSLMKASSNNYYFFKKYQISLKAWKLQQCARPFFILFSMFSSPAPTIQVCESAYLWIHKSKEKYTGKSSTKAKCMHFNLINFHNSKSPSSIKCKATLQSQMTVCQIKEFQLLPNCCCIVDRPSLRDKDHKTSHRTGQTSSAPRNITPRFLCGQIKHISKELQQCSRSLCWRVWNSASTGRKVSRVWNPPAKTKSIQSSSFWWGEFMNQSRTCQSQAFHDN